MRALAPLVLGMFFAAVAPAAALDLRLTGIDDEKMVQGEELDRIRAAGGGATLTMRDRIGCQLEGARCEELHGGAIATGHCEDAYGRGTLRYRGRTTRFFIAGNRCPHAGADVERGVLVSRSGFIDYVMTARRVGTSGKRERVTIRLRKRRAMLRSELSCSACRFLVQYAHGALPAHPTEPEVVAVVEKACNYFPTMYQGVCTTVVERHGRALVTELLAEREAVTVCQRVQACPTRRRSVGRAACQR